MGKRRCSQCHQYLDKKEMICIGLQSFCSYSCLNEKRYARSSATDSVEYEMLRSGVIKADGFRCRMCSAEPAVLGLLHVHHIVYRSGGGSDDPRNLITLCRECHGVVHSNKKVYQPACLELAAERVATGENSRTVRDVVVELAERSLVGERG